MIGEILTFFALGGILGWIVEKWKNPNKDSRKRKKRTS